MSVLKDIREKHNLTQEELSEKSGISVRTIQRIESGTQPKGHTLKALAKTFGVEEAALLGIEQQEPVAPIVLNDDTVPAAATAPDYAMLKLINLSSLPATVFPPVNIILPLALMFITKQKIPLAKQIITLQIIWTIAAVILFMLVIFIRPADKSVTLITMIVLVLSNLYIILRNAMAIDKDKALFYKLNFSLL